MSEPKKDREVIESIERPARAEDLPAIKALMKQALGPYYDGDHEAHAERLLTAHLAGKDKEGHFSEAQLLVVSEVRGEVVGLLNCVIKRQGTMKAGPFVVAPWIKSKRLQNGSIADRIEVAMRKYREERGFRGVRIIYCTYAENNPDLARYVDRRGGESFYTYAGKAEHQYKRGVSEIALYRFVDPEKLRLIMKPISATTTLTIRPMEESDKDRVRELIQTHLTTRAPLVCDGVWITRLFAGWARRMTNDIERKFKVIYVAVTSEGKIVGMLGAGPKKGSATKIMPLVADTPEALGLLVEKAPELLADFGEKIYIHVINQTPEEVIALQRNRWKCEVIIPSMHTPESVTYHWGRLVSLGT